MTSAGLMTPSLLESLINNISEAANSIYEQDMEPGHVQ